MDISGQLKIFRKLPLQSKILISYAGFLFFISLTLIWISFYFSKNTFLWIGITIIVLSTALAIINSKLLAEHNNKIIKIINEYNAGIFNDSIEPHIDDEFYNLKKSLNKLSESFKIQIDEKISNENLAMMGEFATFIIHDLKNPISGIHLLAEGLNKKIADNDELKKYSNEILFASQKLDDFIKRTLDNTRSMVMHIQSLNINKLIDDVILGINFSGIEIKKIIDESLPEMFGDYQLLSRAITNLINNAVESIESAGKIIIETKKEDNLIIRITDNGTGIDENKIKTVFRPFYSSKGQGHGLGLAMAKKSILMHHGTIDVISKAGSGSTFTIVLPFDGKYNNHSAAQNEKELN